ncbi:enoyl-CoA hydratase/isomerase family protein [Leucobacter weissii]|uniref:Enoyl-CoA hydratase/isomerase family protein n=1 Tax=Leucobacter weissii TaxID=1983706 RepID=A0A939MR05_9MICO|nr:enoyl-CoA hydratase/isomerase family protein [Leucobacter weissii]MBO1901429.1 enoyl-CoA hydratase/isomerase family protein [Leucobacter weissii]
MADDEEVSFGTFGLRVEGGVGLVVFERPPVNAFRVSTYEELLAVTEHIEGREDIRAVVLAGGSGSRCWCGGADINDFAEMDEAKRKERYGFVNAVIPRFARLELPVVAAISGHAIGIGVLLAAVCDIRIAADTAQFATPEVNYGLIAGSSRLLNSLGVPEGLVRELAYTGRRAGAAELHEAGFIDHVVPRGRVLEESLSLARAIAVKDRRVLASRKRVFVEHENLAWFDAYLLAQRESSLLVGSDAARRGVDRFLKGSRSSGAG